VTLQKRSLVLGLASCWLIAVTGGMFALWNYSVTPGAPAGPPVTWPEGSAAHRAEGLPTLVMAVHPHCPCSRASVDELNVLMTRGKDRLAVNVLFIRPKGMPEDWEKSDLWQKAAAIPGVRALVDVEAIETQRFQARTSGQVILYDARGKLVFSGGITPARGHAGQSAGKAAILAFLTLGNLPVRTSEVFGCPLFGPNAGCQRKDQGCQHNH